MTWVSNCKSSIKSIVQCGLEIGILNSKVVLKKDKITRKVTHFEEIGITFNSYLNNIRTVLFETQFGSLVCWVKYPFELNVSKFCAMLLLQSHLAFES